MNQRHAVFIDLSNFYGHLINSRIDSPTVLRDYFRTWLDFDVLAQNLTGSSSVDIWVFYSDRRHRLGPDEAIISDYYLSSYIERINGLEGITARNVDIPNSQREYLTVTCPYCGKNAQKNSLSEKGVDASLIVHLFDTMESWDTAYLLAGDADYVPAVISLRRQGKIVIGVGFPENSSSLLRQECYNYVDILDNFIRDDLLAYWLFRTDLFSLTRTSLDELGGKGASDDIRKRLERIQDREFPLKNEFIKVLIELLDEKQFREWKDSIIEHAFKSKGGLIQQWFTEVLSGQSPAAKDAQLSFSLSPSMGRIHQNEPTHYINFMVRGLLVVYQWEQQKQKIEEQLQRIIWKDHSQNSYTYSLTSIQFKSIKRRLQIFSQCIESIPNVKKGKVPDLEHGILDYNMTFS